MVVSISMVLKRKKMFSIKAVFNLVFVVVLLFLISISNM